MDSSSTDDTRASRTNSERDAEYERLVLGLILESHPAQTTFDELVLLTLENPADCAIRDAVHRAVRDLAAEGLLRTVGDLVMPTRAAVRFRDLWSEMA
jgi:hypothetical protein